MAVACFAAPDNDTGLGQFTDHQIFNSLRKHGIKAVSNKVPDSQEPPDHWARNDTPAVIGPYPVPDSPLGNEEFRS